MKFRPTRHDIKRARKHKLKKRGFKTPVRTVVAARLAGLPLSYACAMLLKESFGGANIFGHDAVRNPIKGGHVTRRLYKKYKKYRKLGYGMQGVGPCQLTWYEFQDEADKLGGCWRTFINQYVGFKLLNSHIKAKGLWQGAHDYNGNGDWAVAYANDFVSKVNHLQQLFGRD